MKSFHARLRAISSARAAGPPKLALPIGSVSNAPAIVGRLVAVGHKNMEDLRRAQNSLSASGLGTFYGNKGEHCFSLPSRIIVSLRRAAQSQQQSTFFRNWPNTVPIRSHEKFPHERSSVLRAPQAPQVCAAARQRQQCAYYRHQACGRQPQEPGGACGARRTVCPPADWELLWERKGNIASRQAL